jgi:hypothetical protein
MTEQTEYFLLSLNLADIKFCWIRKIRIQNLILFSLMWSAVVKCYVPKYYHTFSQNNGRTILAENGADSHFSRYSGKEIRAQKYDLTGNFLSIFFSSHFI